MGFFLLPHIPPWYLGGWFWSVFLLPSSYSSMDSFKELSYLVHIVVMIINLIFLYPMQIHCFYPFFGCWHVKYRFFIKIWCGKGMFIIWGEIKPSSIWFLSFWTYIHFFHFVVVGYFFTWLASVRGYCMISQLTSLINFNMLSLIE